jgi:hypothetical protein
VGHLVQSLYKHVFARIVPGVHEKGVPPLDDWRVPVQHRLVGVGLVVVHAGRELHELKAERVPAIPGVVRVYL